MYFGWFTALLAVFSFSSPDALSCYNCIVCEDPFEPSPSVSTQCEAGEDVCVKLDIKTRNGYIVTGRQCAPRNQGGLNICDFFKKSGADLGPVVSCTSCPTNFCNK